MSVRVLIFYLVVAALVIYAYRDWFISLGGLILLTGVAGNMPTSLFGIQGLNAWNVLFVAVVVAWALTRTREGKSWDMPGGAAVLLVAYVCIIVIAGLRMLVDLDSLPAQAEATAGRYLSEYVINSLKYLLLGVLVYDGARTRRRLLFVTVMTVSISFVYALLMARQSSAWLANDVDWSWRRNQAAAMTGLHPNEVAFVLAWGVWGIASVALALRSRLLKLTGLAAAAVVALALAKTACRGAYVTLPCVGVLLGVLRSKVVLGAAAALVVAGLSLEAVTGRLTYGYEDDPTKSVEEIEEARWSGRLTKIWPAALALFAESPVLGHGRVSLMRTPGAVDSYEQSDAVWGHAHCAYLEMLADSGIVGLLVVLALLVPLLLYSIWLARYPDPLVRIVGAVGVSAFATYLIMGVASQSFFPRVEFLGVWCMAGLVLRCRRAYAPAGDLRLNADGRSLTARHGFGRAAPFAPHQGS